MLFLYCLAGFGIFFLLCSIGYIIQHKMIHGSCGGLNNVGVEKVCTCETPCFKRRVKNKIAQLTGKPVSEHHHGVESDTVDQESIEKTENK